MQFDASRNLLRHYALGWRAGDKLRAINGLEPIRSYKDVEASLSEREKRKRERQRRKLKHNM